MSFEARKESSGGWCVIGPNFYLHHSSADICHAIAALLNGDLDRAVNHIARWRET